MKKQGPSDRNLTFFTIQILSMSVLIFIDHTEGHIKKASLEALSYGAKIAAQSGTQAEAILLGSVNDDLAALGKHGITKIHQVKNDQLSQFDSQCTQRSLLQPLKKQGRKHHIFK
jgi:electron transfer flavoprotein alpha subunit